MNNQNTMNVDDIFMKSITNSKRRKQRELGAEMADMSDESLKR